MKIMWENVQELETPLDLFTVIWKDCVCVCVCVCVCERALEGRWDNALVIESAPPCAAPDILCV